MMKKFGFFVIGQKGYQSLASFISEFDASAVSFVVSSRDKNIQKDYYQEIKEICVKHNIEFSNRENFVEKSATLKFAIGWRWIIKNNESLIVFHDSLLPKYRGFAPLVNALINGERKVGVTALRAESEYDSGDIVAQKEKEILYPKKIKDAIADVSRLYAELLLNICRDIIDEKPLYFREQERSKSSFSLWRDEDDYSINWNQSAESIKRFIDAVGFPYQNAKTKIGGEEVRVSDAIVVEDVNVEDRSSHLGKIIFMSSGVPTVICAQGLIKLLAVVDSRESSMIGNIPFRTRFGD